MRRKRIFTFLTDILFYIAGGFIYSTAVLLFLSENGISPGGLTGIATILNYLFSLPIGTVVFVLNIPLLAAAFIKFGGIFIAKTAVATAIMSLMLDISGLFLPTIKIDPILAALFGGLLMGLGISMFMLRGATTGGTDIIAKLINRRFPHLTVGRLMLAADAAVVAATALVYKNIESALYAVIAIYTSSRVMDVILYGADRGKIVYVITDNSKERNDAFNAQILECQGKLTAIRQEEESRSSEELDIPAIRQALDRALSFTGDIDTALVATILDRVIVKRESTKDNIYLDIFLKLGSTYEAVYTPLKHTAGITSLKNITHKPPTRRI